MAVKKIDMINDFLRQKVDENIPFEDTTRMMKEIAEFS